MSTVMTNLTAQKMGVTLKRDKAMTPNQMHERIDDCFSDYIE